MKVAICGTALQEPAANCYPVEGNRTIEYGKKVRFPINAVLAKSIKSGDELKVILIVTRDENNISRDNIGIFRSELEKINIDEHIGAKINYDTIEIPYEPTKDTVDRFLAELINKIPADADVFADITYGMKPTPMIVFCALNFAEKFCNASIKNIIYGKVERNPETKEMTKNPKIFDITPLFYLNRLVETMECPDAETAKKILGDFFAL
jgi:hypothetical protein